MKFYFEYQKKRFNCLKDVYSTEGPDGYNNCRLVVPRPEQFDFVQNTDFRKNITLKLIRLQEQYPASRLVIAYSGGIDSECLAMACIDAGVEVHLRTVAWRSNAYDIDHAKLFAKKFKVRHNIIEIEIESYIQKDLYEWVWGAECVSEVYFSAEKILIDQLDDGEILLLGIGAPPNVQRRDDSRWVIRHPLVDPISYYQYAKYRNKKIWCPYIDDPVTRAIWTRDILTKLKKAGKKFFGDIWQYGIERGISEREWLMAKGILYSSFPELSYRKKFHGWEMELSSALFRVANKMELEYFFGECLKSGNLIAPTNKRAHQFELPENPYYEQSMGTIGWISNCVSPLESFYDWDISSW